MSGKFPSGTKKLKQTNKKRRKQNVCCLKTNQNFRMTRSSVETTFTRPCTGSQKTNGGHERCLCTSRQSVDQPFRQGPSGKQRKSRWSNFSQGTGRGVITKKQRYVKCKHTCTTSSRTNVESSKKSVKSSCKHRKCKNLKLHIPLGAD